MGFLSLFTYLFFSIQLSFLFLNKKRTNEKIELADGRAGGRATMDQNLRRRPEREMGEYKGGGGRRRRKEGKVKRRRKK